MVSDKLIGRVIAAALCVGAFSSGQAAIIHLSGSTVDFYYDDAQPGMAAYGTLSAVGDSIFATPTDFFAESSNGGSDIFSALGTVTVVAKPGYQFDSVLVGQQGDYQMNGAGTAVSTTGDLDVTETGNAANIVSVALVSSSNFTLQDNQLHPWSSAVSVNMGTPQWNGISSIDLTLDSILNASTTINGEFARIQNKFVGGGLVTIVTSPVPLPASFWLFGTGLALLATRRKITASRKSH